MIIRLIINNKNILDNIHKTVKDVGYKIGDGQKNFDALIVETRILNVKINYQIVLALAAQKPVLCLYPEGTNIEKNLPLTQGQIAKNLIVKSYNPKNATHFVKKFLTGLGAETKQNRFNFFLTPDLEEYIKWIPFGRELTKSNFIRRLIKEEMAKDRKYKAFLDNKE